MSEIRKCVLVVVLGAAAGCLSGAPTGTEVAEIGDTCPAWGCGMNSPTIGDGVVFDELDGSGNYEDEHGIKVQSALLDGVAPVELRAVRDELVGWLRSDPGRMLTDSELLRVVITLAARTDTGGLLFEARIVNISKQLLTYWAGRRELVPAYLIAARQLTPLTKQFLPICRATPSTTEPEWRNADHYAVIFSGDHYDARAKKVFDREPGTPWFNLACAGTAPAKMHLMRHTNAGAGADGAYATSIFERQAMLKMFTADYCGGGDAYTVDGQPLYYDDSRHWYAPPPPVPVPVVAADGSVSPVGAAVEALWTERGALCVNTPRHVPRASVPCLVGTKPLPPCKPAVTRVWTTKAHVISVNPPP